MTTQIRLGVFETNSSSTHSITVSTKHCNRYDTLPLDEDNNVVLKGGEFGWEPRTYNDALTKANYLAIYATEWAHTGKEGGKDFFKEEFTETLKKVIRRQTGCNEVIFAFSGDYDDDNWSYIDHQSVESQNYHYLFKSHHQLKEFIFNPNSVLKTDNDNY